MVVKILNFYQAQLFKKASPEFPAMVVGAWDGTYVPIQVGEKDEPYYKCRKFFTAFNVFVCAGADNQIFYVNSDSPGTVPLSSKLDKWHYDTLVLPVTDSE